MLNNFDAHIDELSFRARRVLSHLGVTDIDSLLSITGYDLKNSWYCGKKTTGEIEALQKKLRNARDTSQTSNVRFEYDDAPREFFEALLGILSYRSRNILESLGINELKAFMLVNSDQLLECRHCGLKTAREILTIQSEIKHFVEDQIDKQGFFQPEDLIKVPCLSGIRISDKKGDIGDTEIYADVHDPAPWLYRWINELSRSKKQSQAFKLRKGMLGSTPMTLKATGEQIGVTKERVRQMIIQIEKVATRQQHRLKPLIEKAAEIVETNGGMVSLEDFTKMLLCKGQDGEELKHATGLIVFFAGLKIWTDHGLKLENNVVTFYESSTFLVQNLTSIFEEVAASCADDKIDDKLWSVNYGLLKDMLLKKMAAISGGKRTDTLSDALFNAVLDKLPNKLKRDRGRIYSLTLWKIRFGSATQVLDAVLHWIGNPAHYREVYECAIKWRPDISKIKAYDILHKSNNALSWNRCVFFHKDHAKIPSDIVHDVENWLLGALKENIPFISITGAYQHFQNLCQRAGIISEVALYSCLRQSDHPELLYPRQPFVYLKKGGKGIVPAPVALENFIRDAGGPISYKEVKGFWVGKVFMKVPSFQEVIQRTSNIFRTIDWGFIHIDNAKLDYKLLQHLINHTKKILEVEEQYSVVEIFMDKKEVCKSAGIDDPELLYAVLRCFTKDLFILEYFPTIERRDKGNETNRPSVKRQVIGFVRDYKKPCPTSLLMDHFLRELGYREGKIYNALRENEICKYQTGYVIHLETLEWNDRKQETLENAAGHLYRDTVRAGMIYGRISHLAKSLDLPKLPAGLKWSGYLISDLLNKGNRYLVLGNRRKAFVPIENEHNIHNFESLVGAILKLDWGGSANFSAFEKTLAKAGIIRRTFTSSMLGSREVYVIKDGRMCAGLWNMDWAVLRINI